MPWEPHRSLHLLQSCLNLLHRKFDTPFWADKSTILITTTIIYRVFNISSNNNRANLRVKTWLSMPVRLRSISAWALCCNSRRQISAWSTNILLRCLNLCSRITVLRNTFKHHRKTDSETLQAFQTRRKVRVTKARLLKRKMKKIVMEASNRHKSHFYEKYLKKKRNWRQKRFSFRG